MKFGGIVENEDIMFSENVENSFGIDEMDEVLDPIAV